MVAASDTRKKRVSKKNKKSWRKNTDTSDVDDYLESIRIEERLGGPVDVKPDDELFQIDTDSRKPGLFDENNKLLTKRERRKISKPLRCFESLRNDSCIPDPLIKRNRVRKAGEGKIVMARKVQEHIKTLRKDIKSLKDHAKSELKRERIKKATHVTVDLWDENESSVKLPGDAYWLQAPTLVHTVQTLGKKFGRKAVPSLKKNSVLPAIEAPHPGLSYNPSYADHQDLLQKVVEDEMKLINEEKHINRVTRHMFAKHSERPTEATRLVEMSEGLPFATPAGEDVVSEGSDSEYHAANPPVQNRKKTLQKRNRMKAAHKEQLQKDAAKVEKKKISDIYRLRKLDEEIAKEKAEQARLRDLRDKARAVRSLETKQMSRHKFQEPDRDFNMASELKGNIRNLKTEGDLLKDRFKSLQKRNVIETRVKQKMKRKYKLKKITKKSHKSEQELRAGGCQGLEAELDSIDNEKKKKKKRKNNRQNHEML